MPAERRPHTWFQQRLLDWFRHHGRHDLPWQNPATPYRVWVSEVMLQQTRVTVVVPYFLRFMNAFPDVAALAAAHLDRVLALWSGLGYYARARNLHRAAGLIMERHGGHMPEQLDAWTALPGVGRSTAGAILSLSGGQRQAVLDGNVKRVLARFHAVPGWPGRSSVQRQLWELAEAQLPANRCDAYTQAMMDLGATLCTRSDPACATCPVRDGCAAFATGSVAAYPEPRPGKRLPVCRTRMLLLESEQGVLLEKRPPTGVWAGLWSLPECEPGQEAAICCRQRYGLEPERIHPWAPFRHTFSHYHLDIEPVHVRLATPRGAFDVAERETVWYNSGTSARGLAAPVSRLLERWRTGG